jgi:2-phosphosulfolactate phosphatase
MSEPAIEAALTPGEALEPCDVAIVVDTIRATTTALYALRQGYAEVVCCAEVDDALAAAEQIGASAILAGERECVRIEGFHLGNSPREFDAGQPLGDVLVLTTTNGTRAVLQAQADAPVVLVGALANLSATAAHAARLTRAGRGRVAVRCAGVRGAIALDDVYTAGRLIDALAAYLPEWPMGDAAELARASAAAFTSAYGALSASQSARDLVAADLTDDVRVCAQVDAVDIVAVAEPLEGGRARISAIS